MFTPRRCEQSLLFRRMKGWFPGWTENFTPRGQISPLGKNRPWGQSLPLGAKLRMGLAVARLQRALLKNTLLQNEFGSNPSERFTSFTNPTKTISKKIFIRYNFVGILQLANFKRCNNFIKQNHRNKLTYQCFIYYLHLQLSHYFNFVFALQLFK
jgi:hypothetical protein